MSKRYVRPVKSGYLIMISYNICSSYTIYGGEGLGKEWVESRGFVNRLTGGTVRGKHQTPTEYPGPEYAMY